MIDKLFIFWYYMRYRKPNHSSAMQIIKLQQRKLYKHLNWVTKHSKFFKAYKGQPLEKFPITNKQVMMEHFDSWNTVNLTKEEAMDLALKAEHTRQFNEKCKGITVGLSSGTSHSRGVFLVSEQEKRKWAGYVLAKFLPGSILKPWKIAFFMRANSNLYESVGSKHIQFSFFDITKDITQEYSRLNNLMPDLLVGQPSVLLMIADAIEAGLIHILPQRIISVAEVLEAKDSKRLKKIFKQEIIHQAYQCTEGFLGSTCACGTLHINEDIIYIEKEYIDEKRFIPIVSDFTRKSQPIIRYRLNDILVEKTTPCACGSHFLALEKIEGREDDIFCFKDINNKKVTVFPDLIRRCILFSGEISQYRIVQTNYQEIHVYLDDEKKYSQVQKNIETALKELGIEEIIIYFHAYYQDVGKKLKRVECTIENKEG